MLRSIFYKLILCLLIINCAHKKNYWGVNKSFKDIENNFIVNEDYQIESHYFAKTPLVLAIHGGNIEKGTSELLIEIVQNKMSFYNFKAHSAPDLDPKSLQSGYLHLTSHRFDDTKLVDLAKKSRQCLSLHGHPAVKDKVDFCVGGLNTKLRKKAVQKLKTTFPNYISCELCCPPYHGLHKKNVVNLCQEQGIQIEMSPKARRAILDNKTEFKHKLATLLRELFVSKK